MTWEELKEEAKKMGYEVTEDVFGTESLFIGNLHFGRQGCIWQHYQLTDEIFVKGRTNDQMLAIMKALQ